MDSLPFDLDDLHEDGTPSNASKKRKTAGASGRGVGASSRGVATLTPEQLEKKRANDREAQRAIRERTKDKIESLEREIRDLTSQQPYQELQSIIRQRDAVLAENEDIRRRLTSVITILQPLLAAQALPGENENENGNTNTGSNSHSSNIHPSLSRSDPIADLAQAAQHSVQAVLSQPNNVTTFQPDQYTAAHRSVPPQVGALSPTVAAQSRYSSPYHSSEQDPTSDAQSCVNQRLALDNQRETMQRSHELSENGPVLKFHFLIGSPSSSRNNLVPPTSNWRDSPQNRSLYPSFSDGQNQNRLLLAFQRDRRENTSYASASGQTHSHTSPAYPSISNLLNPTDTTTSSDKPFPSLGRHDPSKLSAFHKPPDRLSTLMTNIISLFHNISNLPERVAIVFIMFIYMRWQIYPTQENYDCLPEWLTPSPSQLFTSHPAWIDYLPFRRLRDKLVHNYTHYPFEKWSGPFTSGLSVNWPYEALDCLISTGDSEEPKINPVFERHIYRLENWTLGPMFAAAFPALADMVHVKDRGNSSMNMSIPLDHSQIPQGLASIGADMGLPMHQGAQGQQQRLDQVAAGSDNGG
ncbi:hypothetical protein LTR70_000453 [Exophiala xenobiotica]|uniref:BZIP transcription factor n=1 Tax=Lithohypha guttulata TaxID=1690604 RepID=A0ABR0KPX0_9EURO|nr:hypothetical protein LTR24_000154 [Lithohypha guttulata]KAK5330623.1 hypothetical protein LTR70_000453 [Exophiala xenobiotica]